MIITPAQKKKQSQQPQLHLPNNMPTHAHIFPEDNMLHGYKLTDKYNKDFACITASSRWNNVPKMTPARSGLWTPTSILIYRCFYTQWRHTIEFSPQFQIARTALTQTPAVTTALSCMNESTTFSSGMLNWEDIWAQYGAQCGDIPSNIEKSNQWFVVSAIQECLNISMRAVADIWIWPARAQQAQNVLHCLGTEQKDKWYFLKLSSTTHCPQRSFSSYNLLNKHFTVLKRMVHQHFYLIQIFT